MDTRQHTETIRLRQKQAQSFYDEAVSRRTTDLVRIGVAGAVFAGSATMMAISIPFVPTFALAGVLIVAGVSVAYNGMMAGISHRNAGQYQELLQELSR